MSFGKDSGSQTVTQTQSLPQWLDKAAQSTLQFGHTVANRPYEAYSGQTVAPANASQQQAYDFTRGQLGAAGGQMQGAAQNLLGMGGFTPERVSAGQFAGSDMAPYMNPYQDQVIDRSVNAIDRQRQMALNDNASAATQSGAYGGSRHGVVDSLTNEAAMRQVGDTTAQLTAAGYDQASNLRMQDLGNSLNAGLANQQAGIQGAGIGMDALRYGGLLSQGAQETNLQSAAALEQAGNAQQGQAQRGLTDQYGRYMDRWNYPQVQLDTMLRSLGGTPYGGSSSTSSPVSGSPLLGGLGGAAAGAGIAGALGLSSPWGLGLAGLGGLAGLFQ